MASTLYDQTRLRWTWLSLSLAAAMVGLVLAGVCLLSGRSAHALGPYRVNSLGDAPDANSDDGICETAIPSECTLRAAIQQAQAASSPGVDTIIITTTGTITLSDNLPTIQETLVISGPGSGNLTIDGTDSFRQFHIASGVEVEISGLTQASGKAPSVGYWSQGGAIYNEGILTLNDVTIVGCSANAGGAIYNALGSIAIIQNGSRIGAADTPNIASWGGGGIYNDGMLAITGTVSYNTADRGAGICNSPIGSATIVGDISHNVANSTNGANGGGILNYQGMMIIRNSSIAYNHTNGSGGGIDNVAGVTGMLTMTNSTVSSNAANHGGGGLRSMGAMLVLNSTIANNVADYDNDGGGDGGGIYHDWGDEGPANSKNNIIADNVDQSGNRDCAYNPLYSGTISSQGYNLVENPGDCSFTTIGDITNTDPLLDSLQDNGGDTLTHALLPGSPAIDAGSCSGATTDQRGWPRPIDVPHIANADDGCDIGAFEGTSGPYFSLNQYLPLILK
jgi:CSLREA domain-containing protein